MFDKTSPAGITVDAATLFILESAARALQTCVESELCSSAAVKLARGLAETLTGLQAQYTQSVAS